MEEQLADVNVPEGGQAGTEDECPFFLFVLFSRSNQTPPERKQ
jgi:hypothetical protein